MINAKSVGGRILHLSASVPVLPAAKPFNVPATVRKSRMSVGVKLSAAMMRIRAKRIVEQQRELLEQFARF